MNDNTQEKFFETVNKSPSSNKNFPLLSLLPGEVLTLIKRNLSLRDIFNFLLVCKTFYKLATNDEIPLNNFSNFLNAYYPTRYSTYYTIEAKEIENSENFYFKNSQFSELLSNYTKRYQNERKIIDNMLKASITTEEITIAGFSLNLPPFLLIFIRFCQNELLEINSKLLEKENKELEKKISFKTAFNRKN